jgi:hypothetical protein
MSGRRRIRRSRSSGGALSHNLRWFLLTGGTMSDDESFTWEAARAGWFLHRDELLRSSPPGPTPYGLSCFESDRFEFLAEIRSMHLELAGLHDVRCEFECLASMHRHQGRVDQADKFELLAENVRTIISELEEGAKR